MGELQYYLVALVSLSHLELVVCSSWFVYVIR